MFSMQVNEKDGIQKNIFSLLLKQTQSYPRNPKQQSHNNCQEKRYGNSKLSAIPHIRASDIAWDIFATATAYQKAHRQHRLMPESKNEVFNYTEPQGITSFGNIRTWPEAITYTCGNYEKPSYAEKRIPG